MIKHDRGQLNIASVILTLVLIVSLVVLAPIFTRFTAMLRAEADPFSALVLALFMPLLMVALIISIGKSAGVT